MLTSTLLTGILTTLPAAPPELGKVEWSRDLDAAYAESSKSGRPVLLLFQEVPG